MLPVSYLSSAREEKCACAREEKRFGAREEKRSKASTLLFSHAREIRHRKATLAYK